MIAWGTYRTRGEALAVIARSGYPPGRLTIAEASCPRTGEARWVLKLAYARHLPFGQVVSAGPKKSAQPGGAA